MSFVTPPISRLTACCRKPAFRWLVLLIVVTTASFVAGFALGDKDPAISFHDMIVNHPDTMSAMIDSRDSRVIALAKELKTPENAYRHVRDRIVFDPSLPSVSAGEIISEGRASCLGKAVLLCSLYRALGLDDSEVRVVTGEIDAVGGAIDHAWVELEHGGRCLQQDTTDLLGRFEFAQFAGMAYTTAFIRREGYVFNDKSFAIVSRLNMMKGSGHPLLTKGSRP